MDRDPAIEKQLRGFLDGRPRQYTSTTQSDLVVQVNGLADTLVTVVKERDQLIQATTAGESAKLWVRILSVAVMAEAAVIGWFATELFSRLGPK